MVQNYDNPLNIGPENIYPNSHISFKPHYVKYPCLWWIYLSSFSGYTWHNCCQARGDLWEWNPADPHIWPLHHVWQVLPDTTYVAIWLWRGQYSALPLYQNKIDKNIFRRKVPTEYLVVFYFQRTYKRCPIKYVQSFVVPCFMMVLESGAGVTKVPFANFSVSKIFHLAKVPVRFPESHSYLTGVTAAELRRHLPNMNAIFNS